MRKNPIKSNTKYCYNIDIAKCMNICELFLVSLSDNKELKCKSYFIKYAKNK